MSRPCIPPFPSGNASSDTQYTQYFEKARTKKQPGNPPEPVLGNPTTTPNPRYREPEPPRVTASPLHQSYLSVGKSPLHHQGNNGSSRSGNSHKTDNPYNPSYPSPKPSKNSASGRSQEGLIGYSTPGRNTPRRSKKKHAEQVQYDHDLVPPFPTDGTNTNYTEVFARYQKDNMSPAAPPVVPYTPRRDESPKLKRCSCFGL